MPKPAGDTWYGSSLGLAVAQGANTWNSSTCKRESLSAECYIDLVCGMQ